MDYGYPHPDDLTPAVQKMLEADGAMDVERERAAGKKLGTRAFIVSDPCGDYGCEVVFAESPGKAKASGMTEHLDFTERAVKRAAHLDKYRGTGGPTGQQLFEAEGWMYECECGGHATADDGGKWIDGSPVCAECVALPDVVPGPTT